LKSWRSLNNHWMIDDENVLMAEVGVEMGFGDAATTFVLRLFVMLFFLFVAFFRLLLLMLGYFFLLRLFLFVLRGFFLLRFLLFRLGVFLFCLGRLGLLFGFGRFGFFFLLVFLLLVLWLLCIEGSRNSEDQRQGCCANDSDCFHEFLLCC